MAETTYEKLSEYIRKKMRMSHIYQPVMIRELLLQGGTANIETIARSLLVHDQSQIDYYALRTKNMVGKVLTANGITEIQKNGRSVAGYALNGAKDLSSTECEELIRACDEAIEAMRRYYRLALQPDLFGGCTLIREWGRVDRGGQLLRQEFDSEGQAADALLAMQDRKAKRGYKG